LAPPALIQVQIRQQYRLTHKAMIFTFTFACTAFIAALTLPLTYQTSRAKDSPGRWACVVPAPRDRDWLRA
jgi:hypothetical protein